MYLVNTRPDITFGVNSLSQFMVEPNGMHWTMEKHVLCYMIQLSMGLDMFEVEVSS